VEQHDGDDGHRPQAVDLGAVSGTGCGHRRSGSVTAGLLAAEGILTTAKRGLVPDDDAVPRACDDVIDALPDRPP
jgi:hypothetical protein